MPQFPIFGKHHEQAEIASRLHDRAELELGLSDPESPNLEHLASDLEDQHGLTLFERMTGGFDWLLRRAADGT